MKKNIHDDEINERVKTRLILIWINARKELLRLFFD
jgi:hypothetical protein